MIICGRPASHRAAAAPESRDVAEIEALDGPKPVAHCDDHA